VNVLSLIGKLRLFQVTRWDEDSSVTYSQEVRQPATVPDANISTSIREDAPEHHALLLDLDVPAWLIPSSTPGHSHLYVDVHIREAEYFQLLDALANAGVIQRGYADASKRRGGTALRLPWIKKEIDQ
jgi:hypothetical protein